MSYPNTLEKTKKTPTRSHSDFVFGRIGFLGILFVLYTFFILNMPKMLGFALKAVWVLAIGFAAASVVLFILSAREKKTEGKILTFGFLARTALSAALLFAVTFCFREPTTLVILGFVAVCLAFVRLMFSHDFFWLSATLSAGVLFAVLPRVFVVFGGVRNDILVYGSAALAVLSALALVIASLVALRGGRFGHRFFNAGYVRLYPLFVIPGCVVAATLLRLFFPAALSYALTAFVVLYFIFLIAYAFDSAK